MMGYANFATNDYVSQDELVSNNMDLVKRIANHLSARLPSVVEINDLLQAGMIGLLEASNNFDPSKGASFDTYAGIRIRGAMLDEVRRLDWTPRSVHRKHREASEVVRSIEAETGRPAESRDIAARLGISIDEYHDILRDTAGCRLFILEETLDEPSHAHAMPSSDTATPDQTLDQDQVRQRLAEGIKRLPEREQMVLSLYYERELNLKEIGAVLGVSESRVCQIHGQALIRLRSVAS
jgi:RNA polymerase sigma factor for flagellar operon FliA